MVTGVRERADAVAFCIALALRHASAPEAPLVVISGGSAPRPGLLASSAARQREETINELALGGVAVAARGHLCVAAVTPEPDGESAIAQLAAQPGRLVASVAPSALERWQRRLTVVRADLPAQRDLLVLLADSLGATSLRIDKRGPGRIGARRALRGLDPGRPAQERYRWLCRGCP